MRVIEIDSPGANARLVPAERAAPTPGPGEVLIEVHAAGVNRPDLLQRRGLYPPPPGASDVPGLEVAGTVIGRGPSTRELRLGDRVMALLAGGGYAELASAPEGQCLTVPEGMSFQEAAALPEGLFTVFANCVELGRLDAGQSLLVHGGTSGIGTLALRVAKLLGARVFTTSRTATKRDRCAELGADRAVLCPDEDFVRAVQDETAGRGVDVVLDMVGRAYFADNLRALAQGGRLVSIAFLSGGKVELDLMSVMRGRFMITGSTLRDRSVEEKTHLRDALRGRLGQALEQLRLRPVVSEVFPLAEAAGAHARLESGEVVGKLVLTVR